MTENAKNYDDRNAVPGEVVDGGLSDIHPTSHAGRMGTGNIAGVASTVLPVHRPTEPTKLRVTQLVTRISWVVLIGWEGHKTETKTFAKVPLAMFKVLTPSMIRSWAADTVAATLVMAAMMAMMAMVK